MWIPRRNRGPGRRSRNGVSEPGIPGFHQARILSAGRESTVYRALRDGSDTPVVLKICRNQPAQAYPHEFDVWWGLANRPGIAPLLELDVTESGTPYAVMEEYSGSYREQLRQGPLPVDEVLSVGITVAQALTMLHAEGYLHHDVTPENILRGPGGPLLTDFGSALPLHSPFPPVSVDATTIRQLPPEALVNGAPTPASDVYRLGVTLWTLLTGHAPFDRKGQRPLSVEDYRAGMLTQLPPASSRTDTPEWLQLILVHALAPRPEERCATPEALGAALQNATPNPVATTAQYTIPELPPGAVPRAYAAPDPPPAAAPEPDSGRGPESPPPGQDTDASGSAPPPDGYTQDPPDSPAATATPPPASTTPAGGTPLDTSAHEPARGWGRRLVPMALAALVLTVVGVGALLLGRTIGVPFATAGSTEEPRPSPTTTSDPTTPSGEATDLLDEETADTDQAPSGVDLDDGGISVRLSWTDNTSGEDAHHVVGGPEDQPVASMARADPGENRVEIIGLNTEVDYCFTVVALVDPETTAPGPQVCTERATETTDSPESPSPNTPRE
ncbi:serine/threonine-protein kinase [Lipingzhangella sp. LS1_29]|uniref:non-specific serine/threonine protein kinase n=1 Tax=Lipingzhangella rawalii TaxID=2055835 RepID=A0ABU2H4J5_9ACTN|nr:serine/threonine-protein kinase [Lipingzhangella rawalii]MDS1270221.1 serine/threonine-protein kinase [Lipingzhangella rawalii]